MRVPLLDLKAQHAELGEALFDAVRRVLDSGQMILGPEVAAFERELAEAAGRRFAVGVSSGSDALLASLMALGVGAGDEVVTTPFSFFATVGAIVRLGARPVFADIARDTFNLDDDAAAERVGKKTRAIVPVHLFGRPATLRALAASGVPIVEDAAQAVGSPEVGGAGALTAVSFFPSKNLGAAGDAGAVLGDDEALVDRVRLLRTHGSRPKYIHSVVGGNFRMDTLQAAILRVKLPRLAEWNARRRRHAEHYRARLASTPLGLPSDARGHVWHHFVVRAPRRDALRDFLRERDVESEVYYPMPLHLQPSLAALGYRAGDLPEAERAAAEALALPVHAQLDAAQLDAVVAAVRAFYGSRS